mmetsp:Transcript_31866/g.100493  ORF Transcript_31866/g.100493 Transcript_31866/m.100493 type:complete len:206 (+) Transcript_31866:229-846(+)
MFAQAATAAERLSCVRWQAGKTPIRVRRLCIDRSKDSEMPTPPSAPSVARARVPTSSPPPPAAGAPCARSLVCGSAGSLASQRAKPAICALAFVRQVGGVFGLTKAPPNTWKYAKCERVCASGSRTKVAAKKWPPARRYTDARSSSRGRNLRWNKRNSSGRWNSTSTRLCRQAKRVEFAALVPTERPSGSASALTMSPPYRWPCQ